MKKRKSSWVLLAISFYHSISYSRSFAKRGWTFLQEISWLYIYFGHTDDVVTIRIDLQF